MQSLNFLGEYVNMDSNILNVFSGRFGLVGVDEGWLKQPHLPNSDWTLGLHTCGMSS